MPGLIAVTLPKRSTLATDGLELRQVTAMSAAGRSVPPTFHPFTRWPSVTSV